MGRDSRVVDGLAGLDRDEDLNLRNSAFFAPERHGPTGRGLAVFKRLTADPDLGPSATRVLKNGKGPEFS